MNREGIKKFLTIIGVDPETFVDSDEWVSCSCPLARIRHEKKTDEKPSFGVIVDAKGPSFYHCFTCTHTMLPLSSLCFDAWLMSGMKHYPYGAMAICLADENEIYRFDHKSFDPTSIFGDQREDEKEYKPLPKRVIKQYPLIMESTGAEARLSRRYLNKRGISDEAIERGQVRYSPDRETIVYPFTNRQGDIYSFRMRLRVKKKMWTVSEKIAAEDCGKEYPKGRFAKRTQVGYWFGLHLMDWDKPVILIESEDDSMRLWDLGKPNSMASGGVGITKRQLSEILALQILLGLDADRAGKEAQKRIQYLLKDRAVLYSINWAKAIRKDGTRCKDSRDLPDEDALIKVFSNIKRLS